MLGVSRGRRLLRFMKSGETRRVAVQYKTYLDPLFNPAQKHRRSARAKREANRPPQKLYFVSVWHPVNLAVLSCPVPA